MAYFIIPTCVQFSTTTFPALHSLSRFRGQVYLLTAKQKTIIGTRSRAGSRTCSITFLHSLLYGSPRAKDGNLTFARTEPRLIKPSIPPTWNHDMEGRMSKKGNQKIFITRRKVGPRVSNHTTALCIVRNSNVS